MKTPIKCFPLAILIAFLSINYETFAQVGIGIVSPNTSAMLDIVSSAKGVLIPRMTTLQRTPGISSPATGLLVYDTDTNSFWFFNGTVWVNLASAGGYVDLTTNQIIAGIKTFSNDIIPEGRIKVPMGELAYFNTVGTLITMSSASDGSTNMVAVNPATALTTGVYEFSNGGSNDGTLEYTGAQAKMFHIAVTISGTPGSSNDVFVFGVKLNTDIITTGKVLGSSSGTQFSSLHIMLMLDTNDKIQLWMGNVSGARNFTVKSLNFFAMGM